MGIAKTLSNYEGKGQDIGYFCICGYSDDKINSNVVMDIRGFTSKVNKDAGEKSFASSIHTLSGNNYPLGLTEQQVAGKDNYALLYDKIHESADTGTIIMRESGEEFDIHDGTAS